MRDKLIELQKQAQNDWLRKEYEHETHKDLAEYVADHLIANNVFVLPEKLKDSWELALPFMMRLFVADEAEIEKIKGEFEFSQKKKILTDIRDYLLTEKCRVANGDIFLLQIQEVEKFADKALSDLTEYAEKLGVEL